MDVPLNSLKTGFPPIIGPDAEILILGSMPSEASLKYQQYYAHPRNAFWPIMGSILGFAVEDDYQQRVGTLERNGIAVWDVLQSCEREGSLDSSIVATTAVMNDFQALLEQHAGITHIFFNGAHAEKEFRRKVLPDLCLKTMPVLFRLPSSSPAMAQLTVVEKTQAWIEALRARESISKYK